jgi:superkiller protein 3
MQLGLSLLAVFLFGIPQSVTVSGRILDREGKPFAGARITYTHAGDYSRTGSSGGQQTGMTGGGTGRVYKTETDKKGQFLIVGLSPGVYEIQIADAAGATVYSTKRLVGENTDKDISNVLNVDLSTAGSEGSTAAGGKMSREQIMQARQHNTTAAAVNRLIPDLHAALDVQDWTHATELLQQLLALEPNRWQFYQNLGTIQNSTGKYQEAAETFAKGVELAEKDLAGTGDPAHLKTEISGMMLSEGDALNRLDRLDDAMALYNQAAALAPQPAMAYFYACNAQSNRGTQAAAIAFCGKAISADPSRPEFYQVLAGAQSASGKVQDAIDTYSRGERAAREELAAKPDSTRAKNALGQMLNAEGNLYAQESQYDKAIAAFAESAKVSAYAALPYFNLCAMYYNQGRMPEAVNACDQAIASDPTISEAYYIKACVLFGQGKAINGIYTAPAEARSTMNKYLQLAPFGEHAKYIREMLEKLDSPANPDYKAEKPVRK